MSRTNLSVAVDRAGSNDLVILATDRGPAPMNMGAVLVLQAAGDLDFRIVRETLASRLQRVPRLRRRLLSTPPGCGRPVWVDDPHFDLTRHLSETVLPPSPVPPTDFADGPDRRLLQIAADMVCTPLPRHQPLWTARWVSGLAHDRAALVLVMHHAMTDGVGGLAVLSAIGDVGVDPIFDAFPQPRPGLWSLAVDAGRNRAAAVASIPSRLGAGRQGLRELGIGSRRPRLAARTAFNRPTGARRGLTTTAVPLADVVGLAHRRGCTVNDVILAAVTGAMTAVLHLRGEHPAELVVSMPISARPSTNAQDLGNRTGAVPLAIPTLADQNARLRCIAALTGGHHGGPRGTSAGPMGAAFRALAAVGLFEVFIDHQRLVNTFVTNVHGPEAAVHFAGHRISAVIPLAVTPGNVGVCYDVLSYAGQLVITVVADPDLLPEQVLLTRSLADELAVLIALDVNE